MWTTERLCACGSPDGSFVVLGSNSGSSRPPPNDVAKYGAPSCVVQEELAALVALAELHRRRGEPEPARAVLEDVWDPAERGPYPMFHADGLNLLARIERDAGNSPAAVAPAMEAYRLSWCDGPPFAYHWGLEAARKHLAELGVEPPDLPPFDQSKFDPMPDVEINPPDEFE